MKSIEQIVFFWYFFWYYEKKWASVNYQIFKLANSLILSIQPHVFLTGYPLTNACRIPRGNFDFDRGMTPPPKSVCKKPTEADLGERRGAFTSRVRPTWVLKGLTVKIYYFL